MTYSVWSRKTMFRSYLTDNWNNDIISDNRCGSDEDTCLVYEVSDITEIIVLYYLLENCYVQGNIAWMQRMKVSFKKDFEVTTVTPLHDKFRSRHRKLAVPRPSNV